MFDATCWKLTLPTGQEGKPTEVVGELKKPVPNVFERFKPVPNVFEHLPAGGGFKMTCPVDGVTTKNSKYPRCEFREMKNGELAAWSMKDHVEMLFEGSINLVPPNKPQAVIAQVHDVFFIRYTAPGHIDVAHNNTEYGYIATKYLRGDKYTIHIEINQSIVTIAYYSTNERKTLSFTAKTVDGCYFKVGNYLQSNTSYDKHGSSVVHLYDCSVLHRGGLV